MQDNASIDRRKERVLAKQARCWLRKRKTHKKRKKQMMGEKLKETLLKVL
ncbi:MAG: hypothetical protein QW594_04160 [Candidatus Woesearchaeota archaeon]